MFLSYAFIVRIILLFTFYAGALAAAEDGSVGQQSTSVLDQQTVANFPDEVEEQEVAGRKNNVEGSALKKQAFPMLFHGQASLLNFYLPSKHFSASKRAQNATLLLESHLDRLEGNLENNDGDSELTKDRLLRITIKKVENEIYIRIGETLLATLNESDLSVQNVGFVDYQNNMRQSLQTFVENQYQKYQLRNFFLHLFLSVFIIVLLFLSLRALRDLFDKWDLYLEESKEQIKSFSILKIPVVSAEALEAASAFALSVGRYVVYLLVSLVAIATVLSRFKSTRPLLARLISGGSEPIVKGLEYFLSSIPGWILAIVIFFLAKAALRVVYLLFDSMQAGSLEWKFLPPKRIPLVRKWFSTLFLLVLAPFFFAAAFGYFGNTFEHVILLLVAVLILSSLPLFSAWIIGAVIIWNEELRAGEWIKVGQTTGEITTLEMKHIVVVPENGGSITIPYFLLLFYPLEHLKQGPLIFYTFSVYNDLPVQKILSLLKESLKEVQNVIEVELVSLSEKEYTFKISAPSDHRNIREQLLIRLSELNETKDLRLSSDGF